ncbi:MAG TPA: helix-turn-helix domain-containing protein [Gemmatimonadaceae bacterium]|nr:helix-turn-helix domain-containing protein [Gemmatimonadaceae bacterium]
MGLVATLLPSQLRLSRLRAALRDRYTVVTCADWNDLLRACANEPVSMAVIDLFASTSLNDAFDSLRQLKRRFPSVAVVLYASVPPAQPRDFFEAGRFGLDGLVMADVDDEPRRLLGLIEQAEARGVLETLRRALGDVKPTVRDATLIGVTRAHQRLSPEGLAKILGVRRKNLSERLAQAGFPTAQRLIAWGRLIVAARMLEDSERSADSVALALDFPSGSAFRNTCQRYLHAAPQQIRARGGASYVIGAFLRQIQNPARAQSTNGRDAAHIPQLAV